MACWVVPAIAAELWGVTVNHVLAGIRDGSVASRAEHGFVFVDAAPCGHTYHRPRRPGERPPATFVLIQPAETALPPQLSHDDEGAGSSLAESVTSPVAEDDELPPIDEEEDDKPLPPRDAIRAAVARQRRGPLAA